MMPVSGYKDNGTKKIRLVTVYNTCAGRVELYYRGQWGAVCWNDFGTNEAHVACRQVGCGEAESYSRFYNYIDDVPIWLDRVHCTGNETNIWDCPSDTWGHHECDLRMQAAVVCKGGLHLSLADGGSPCAGRLELTSSIAKGSFHDDAIDSNVAQVLCWQLDCGSAVSMKTGAYFGETIGPFWIFPVHCSGNESFIWQCNSDLSFSIDSVNYPQKNHRAPRLVDGEDSCSGRVEVQFGETWGTLCDTHWDMHDASVVCKQLQCGVAVATPGGAHFGEGRGPMWEEQFDCWGNESILFDCPVSRKDHNCTHGSHAAVICSEEDWLLRLRGGESRCDGSVEVFLNSTWGRVSDTEWDLQDASVVCRHLNCGLAIEAHNPSKYAPGNSPVLLSQIECKGNESSLQGCHFSQSNESANSSVSVGVLCTGHTRKPAVTTISKERVCAGPGSSEGYDPVYEEIDQRLHMKRLDHSAELPESRCEDVGSDTEKVEDVQQEKDAEYDDIEENDYVNETEDSAELPDAGYDDVGHDTHTARDGQLDPDADYDDIEENDYINLFENSAGSLYDDTGIYLEQETLVRAELPDAGYDDVGHDTHTARDGQLDPDADYDDIEENDYINLFENSAGSLYDDTGIYLEQETLVRDLINNHKSVHGDAPSASGCMAGSWRNPGQAAARNQSTTFSATYTPQVRPYAPRPAVHWRKKYSLSNQKAGPPGNNLSIAGTPDCPTAAITAAQPRVLSTKGSSTKAVTRTPNLVQPSPFAAPIQHTGLGEMGAKPGSAGVRTGLATPISRSNSSQIAGEQGTSKSAGLQKTLSSLSPAGGAGSSTGLVLDTSKSSSVESAALLSKMIGDCSVATGQGQIKGKSRVVVRTVLSPQAAGGASFSGPVPSAAESFTPDRRLLLSKSAGSRSVEAQGQSMDKLLPQASHPHSIKKPSILDKAVLNPKAAVGINNSGHAHRTCNLTTAVPCNAQVESKTFFIDRTASIPKPSGGATGLCCSRAKPSALSSCSAKANPVGVLQADNKPQSLTALPSGVPLSSSPVKNSKYTWVKKPVQGLAEPSRARAGTSSTSAESTAMPVSPHHRPKLGLAGSIFKRRAAAGQKSHKGPGQSARPLKAAKTRYTWVSTTANSAKPARKPLSPKALEGTQKAPKSLELKKSVTPPGAKPSKKASTSPKPSGTGSKYRWKAATAGQAAAAAKPVFKWKSEKENGKRGSPGSGQPSSAEHSATGASGGSSPSLSGYKLKSRMKIIRKNSGPG
ncbi:UNVERIFIED_CONTAM: hypothetical protein FKN15_066486 [Acipenser sinensis]